MHRADEPGWGDSFERAIDACLIGGPETLKFPGAPRWRGMGEQLEGNRADLGHGLGMVPVAHGSAGVEPEVDEALPLTESAPRQEHLRIAACGIGHGHLEYGRNAAGSSCPCLAAEIAALGM